MAREISRYEAARRGLKRFFTGKECKKGHLAERYVRNGACVACADEARWRIQDELKALQAQAREDAARREQARLAAVIAPGAEMAKGGA